uniref:Uncharacterized protein n=1 Tax=Triticum urartu TaxID=4572 RepID=A0A8R7RBT9_TRIUA
MPRCRSHLFLLCAGQTTTTTTTRGRRHDGLDDKVENPDMEGRQILPRVLLASDCFLPDTPIQMTVAAMASTLKRAYLSIYNWVHVLYYALLDSLPGRVRRQLRGVSSLRRPLSGSIIDQLSVTCRRVF